MAARSTNSIELLHNRYADEWQQTPSSLSSLPRSSKSSLSLCSAIYSEDTLEPAMIETQLPPACTQAWGERGMFFPTNNSSNGGNRSAFGNIKVTMKTSKSDGRGSTRIADNSASNQLDSVLAQSAPSCDNKENSSNNNMKNSCSSDNSSDVDERCIIRNLDPTESFWNSYHLVGNVMILSTVSILSNRTIRLDHLKKAAYIMACRHQTLRVTIGYRNEALSTYSSVSRANNTNGGKLNERCISDDSIGRNSSNKSKMTNSICSSNSANTANTSRANGNLPIIIANNELNNVDANCTSSSSNSSATTSTSSSSRNNRRNVPYDEHYYWINHDASSIRLDIEQSYIASKSYPLKYSPSLHWLEALGREQTIQFDIHRGPLWRLRLLSSVECIEEPEGTGDERGFCYRTYILGCFHHAIMDGLSRQVFWNELTSILAVISANTNSCIDHQNDYDNTTTYTNGRPHVFSSTRPAQASPQAITNTSSLISRSAVSPRTLRFCRSSSLPETRLPDPVENAFVDSLGYNIMARLFPLLRTGVVLTAVQRRILGPLRNPFSYAFSRKSYGDNLRVSQTSIIPLWVPMDVSKRLQQLCKERRIPFNGLVTAVAALAIVRLITNKHKVDKVLAWNGSQMKLKAKGSSSRIGSTYSESNNTKGKSTSNKGVTRTNSEGKNVTISDTVVIDYDTRGDNTTIRANETNVTTSIATEAAKKAEIISNRSSSAVSSNGTFRSVRGVSKSVSTVSDCITPYVLADDHDSFPLPVDTPAAQTRAKYLPWNLVYSNKYHNIANGSTNTSNQYTKKIKFKPSLFYNRKPLLTQSSPSSSLLAPAEVPCQAVDSRLFSSPRPFFYSRLFSKRNRKHHTKRSSWRVRNRLPIHMTSMQAISCRRWINSSTVCASNNKSGKEDFIKGLEEYYYMMRDGVNNNDSEPYTAANGDSFMSNTSTATQSFHGTGSSDFTTIEEVVTQLITADEEKAETSKEKSIHITSGSSFATDTDSRLCNSTTGSSTTGSSTPTTNGTSTTASPYTTPIYNRSPEPATASMIAVSNDYASTSWLASLQNESTNCTKPSTLSSSVSLPQIAAPPGLGSYAALMPRSIWVSRKCDADRNFWSFASRAAKDVHAAVDRSSSKKATLPWQIMSGFICKASNAHSILKNLASPHPRPSSFMISNGGKWDSSLLETVVDKLNKDWIRNASIADAGSGSNDNSSCSNAGNIATTASLAPAVTTTTTTTNASGTGNSGKNDFRYEIESSWSCVAQHEAGVNMFCHNIVTLNNRMCWSLQYHTNLTSKRLATEYGLQILIILQTLVDYSAPSNEAGNSIITSNSNSENNDSTTTDGVQRVGSSSRSSA